MDWDAADSAWTVAAARPVCRPMAGLLVCLFLPGLRTRVCRFAHSAMAARQASVGDLVCDLVNVPEGVAKIRAAPPSKNIRQFLESSAQGEISLGCHLFTLLRIGRRNADEFRGELPSFHASSTLDWNYGAGRGSATMTVTPETTGAAVCTGKVCTNAEAYSRSGAAGA